MSWFAEIRRLDDRNYPVESDRDGWTGALGVDSRRRRTRPTSAQVSADDRWTGRGPLDRPTTAGPADRLHRFSTGSYWSLVCGFLRFVCSTSNPKRAAISVVSCLTALIVSKADYCNSVLACLPVLLVLRQVFFIGSR